MCGIGLLCHNNKPCEDNNHVAILELNRQLSQSLSNRGPDVPCKQYHVQNYQEYNITLHASVLHMRGNQPLAQPVLFSASSSDDDQKSALCWNGECYTYTEEETNECSTNNNLIYANMVELVSMEEQQSDTILISNILQNAINQSQNIDNNHEHDAIAKAIGRIHGEFAFILYVPSSRSIYYGRDCLGRRSLLINKSIAINGITAISSVTFDSMKNNTWEEVSPGIVYRLDLCTNEQSSIPIPRNINMNIQRLVSDMSIKDTNESLDAAANNLLQLLDKSVQRRVMHAPPSKSQSATDASVAVLFSGGIDSVVLAALSHRHVPHNQPIDLINVSFYNDKTNGGNNNIPNSPDRLAAILSYHEMLLRFPERNWRFIAVDVPYQEVLDHEKHIRQLISPLESTMDYNISTAFWFAARGKGRLLDMDEVENVRRSLDEKKEDTSSQEPLLRFANGDQSINNKKEISKQTCIRPGCTRLAPVSGCLFHACKFCCCKYQNPISSYLGRNAMICPIHNNDNKDIKEKKKKRGKVPKQEGPDKSITTTSQAKILLSGVGADEQMAGYGRHRTTYQRSGYDALREELQMEVDRLWIRNLGRDDRCLSDHGKEARFPYLDEDLVAFLEAIPVDQKCNLDLPPGEGDKLILRKVARMIGVEVSIYSVQY